MVEEQAEGEYLACDSTALNTRGDTEPTSLISESLPFLNPQIWYWVFYSLFWRNPVKVI